MTAAERRQALDRAGALADLGRVEAAAGVYAGLLAAEPDDVQALCGLSRCLGKMGRAEAGLELANRAAALAPASDWPHRLRSAHLLLMGRPRPALEAARTALALDPSGFVSQLSVFEAEVALRSRLPAAATARIMVASHPSEPESHNAVGRAAMLRRDWTAAEAAFREALRLAPQEPVYRSNLAVALERRGHGDEAMRHFRQAVRTDPGNATARRQLALAIDRRLAVAGVGAGLVGGLAASVIRHLAEPVGWAVGAALVALIVGAVLALRWWRLHNLDETLRTFYSHERRRWGRLRGEVAAGAAVVMGGCGALIVAAAGLSRSWLLIAVVLVLVAVPPRYPSGHLWRREVLHRLQARHRELRWR